MQVQLLLLKIPLGLSPILDPNNPNRSVAAIVIGVIELLSYKNIEEYRIQFVLKAGETLTSILSTIKAKDKTDKIIEKQRLLTEELTSHDEELRQNLEEMKATQEEATRKSQETEKRENEYMAKIKELEKTISKMRSK